MSDEGHSFFPNEVFHLGWSRWMPVNAFYLYGLVGTATVENIDGSLDELMSTLPIGKVYPQGANTPLLWRDPDESEDEDVDSEEDSGEVDRARFANAVAHIAEPPETIGDYGRILALLGVFTHTTTDASEQWRVASPIPLPTEVLRLDPAIAAEEDWLRWRFSVAEDYAQAILHVLYSDEHVQLDTSLERFAQRCELDPEACRQGLMALAESGEVVTVRLDKIVDVERLLGHARFTIEPQWEVLAEKRFTVKRAD